MNNKLINKEIRKVSNYSSLPVLIFCVLSLIIQKALGMLITSLYNNGNFPGEDWYYLIAYCLQYFVIAGSAMFIFFVLRRKSTGLTLTSTFRRPQMPISWIIKWIVIGIGAGYITSYLTNYLYTMLQEILDIEFTPIDMDFGDTALSVFTMFFAVTILAPIFEELMFRGTIYRNTEVMGQPFAIITSGIAFGLWHMNYTQVVFAAVLGIIMAYIFAKTRSIFPCMILHFIVNMISTIMSLAIADLDMDKLSTSDTTYIMNHFFEFSIAFLAILCIFAFMIASVVLIIIELVKYGNQFKLKKSVFPVSGLKKIAVYFSAPITIITFVYMIGMTIYNAFNN